MNSTPTPPSTITIKREIELEAEPERCWGAISDADAMETWLADEVDLEPVEGSPASFTVDGEERPGRVERVIEGRELCFTWEREPGLPSLVELRLTPSYRGTTVTVTETDLGPGPIASIGAWTAPLSRLRTRFTLVCA
jgi:uncharacterized protein YndB with AHSA1/START domain